MVWKCGNVSSGSRVKRTANSEMEHRTQRSTMRNAVSELWNPVSEKWNVLSHPYPHIYLVISLLVLFSNLFNR